MNTSFSYPRSGNVQKSVCVGFYGEGMNVFFQLQTKVSPSLPPTISFFSIVIPLTETSTDLSCPCGRCLRVHLSSASRMRTLKSSILHLLQQGLQDLMAEKDGWRCLARPFVLKRSVMARSSGTKTYANLFPPFFSFNYQLSFDHRRHDSNPVTFLQLT